MKKNYFMLAAATMMFAACAETDLVNEIAVEETPQAIGFDAFANKTTRAENGTDLIELKKNGFKVWGYKTSGNYNYTVFEGEEVSWKEATNNVDAHWGYDETKYWDEKATYNFYAVAPYDNQSTITDGKIKITDIASAKSTSSKDYVIDRAGNTSVAGSAKATVGFDFNHIMAKLSFILKAGVEEDITVTSLTMTGWDNRVGIFTQTETSTPNNNTHTEWSWPENSNIIAGELTLVGDDAGDPEISLPETKAEVQVQDKYIMVPQTISYVAANLTNSTEESGLTFTISYEIGNEVFTEQVGVVQATQIWGTDTHTTYTITVAPHAIEFNVNTVAGFCYDTNTGSSTIE